MLCPPEDRKSTWRGIRVASGSWESPKIDNQQGIRDVSLVTPRNWILPVTGVSVEEGPVFQRRIQQMNTGEVISV